MSRLLYHEAGSMNDVSHYRIYRRALGGEGLGDPFGSRIRRRDVSNLGICLRPQAFDLGGHGSFLCGQCALVQGKRLSGRTPRPRQIQHFMAGSVSARRYFCSAVMGASLTCPWASTQQSSQWSGISSAAPSQVAQAALPQPLQRQRS